MAAELSLPLFDELPPAAHATAFGQAFEAWLADQRGAGLLRRDGSASVYKDMWEAFATWCLGQSPAVTLPSLALTDLQAFQAARFGRKTSDLSLTPRYALRLMRLIDRVLRHHAAQTDAVVNTAAADWIQANPEVRYADAAHADPLPEYLPVSEARQLIAFLSAARPRPGVPRNAHAGLTWQEVRNRASVALQLGAGLTPGDVRALTLDSPVAQGGRVRERPWKLHVPGDGNSPARETPMAPWAAELLQHWLAVRTEAGIVGTYLFPSTRTGKQWQKPSQYECAKRVLEEAGMDSREGGSFRLRHTFALRQLRRGTSPEQVARWLGIEPAKMKRYERVLPDVVEVV
ncbi:Phage integrase family protein [Variovorax sp. YR266]|uniref:tyrosine-type recombinase/integrase n=1 Tax=Variovorax sp. YR266 TaxID=1884386 RepID=UPI0008942EB6|nr:site-specific integrase [Variovorax sp. YR266]SDZ70533.1 Phage integrase family protein [Variovorax sp. YR266]